jgi:hypothetical protein
MTSTESNKEHTHDGPCPCGRNAVSPSVRARDLDLPEWEGISVRDPALNFPEINAFIKDVAIVDAMENGQAAPGRPMSQFSEQALDALDTLLSRVCALRQETFELLGGGPDAALGRLREGKSVDDRDKYVRTLDEYLKLSAVARPLWKLCGDRRRMHVIYFYRGGALYGDREALYDGRRVPDLPHNHRQKTVKSGTSTSL